MEKTNGTPLSGEIRSHGTLLLRYHFAPFYGVEQESVGSFYESFAAALRDYAEEEGKRLSAEYEALPRRERGRFSPLFMTGAATLLYADGTWVSVLYRFAVSDKRGPIREVLSAATFEGKTGRLCSPYEFLGKGKKAPSESFYLTKEGPVFLDSVF